MDKQQLANMVLQGCHRYDHRWAEYVCRYCNVVDRHGHTTDCEIHTVQKIANEEEQDAEG